MVDDEKMAQVGDSETTQTIVQLEKIRKTYTGPVDEEVLFGIDLRINTGDFAVLVGKSGSGKTTLLNIIGLLDTPTSGRLFLNDRETSTLNSKERAKLRREYIEFIFQFHYLLLDFNVIENVLMPCRIIGRAAEKKPTKEPSRCYSSLGSATRFKRQ